MNNLLLFKLISIIFMSTGVFADINVYFENDYGADIVYKLGDAHSATRERNIANSERVFLGPLEKLTTISIRTNKIGSSYFASFEGLGYVINNINKTAEKYLHKDVVIVINPSFFCEDWNISVFWERQGDIKEINFQLEAIIYGSLGDDYSKKARDIYDYNYATATRAGFIDLRRVLLQEIENLKPSTQLVDPRRKKPWVLPSPSTIDDLKISINSLHRALGKYRVRDRSHAQPNRSALEVRE